LEVLEVELEVLGVVVPLEPLVEGLDVYRADAGVPLLQQVADEVAADEAADSRDNDDLVLLHPTPPPAAPVVPRKGGGPPCGTAGWRARSGVRVLRTLRAAEIRVDADGDHGDKKGPEM